MTILHVIALSSAVACAVPVFCRDRDAFRVACATAGVVVAVASVFPVLMLGWIAIVGAGWSPFLVFLLPTAAIPALVAAFQRARGRQYGLVASAFGWFTGLASIAGWTLVVCLIASWR
ncbi:hypothetical protein F7Q99_05350 [Streptomyces kaniharaensis]|uniref:Uncharacterized protein n=1 Tax=Streptomyces kaniharaensis TaxID=212423 RepID=A0A6N7KMD5_9ACTN|nr:hypothetical protein [Streptomyces kaniharaensis]MQS11729.1 hypothetical protein [Streptomyces kaniharaensis]